MKERYKEYRSLPLRELQLLQLDSMKEIHKVCINNNIKYYIIAGSLLGAIRHGGFIPWDDDIDIAMFRKDYERFREIFYNEFSAEKYFLQDGFSDIDFSAALMRFCIKDTLQDIPSEYHLRNQKFSYIDIFPLDNVPDNELLREKQSNNLLKLNKRIARKLYRIYPSNSKSVIIAKKILSLLYNVIPLNKLHKQLYNEMTRYDNIKTMCVSSMASKYGYKKQIMPSNIYGEPQLLKFEDTYFYAPERYMEYLERLYGKNYMQLPPVAKRIKPHPVYIKESILS